MRPFNLRFLIPLTVVVLLLPSCSDSADDGADTTLAATTTTAAAATTTVEATTTTTVATTTAVDSDSDSVGDDGRVPVVGTSTFVREDADSTQTQAGDVLEARDLVWIYEQVMSDERVSGTSTVTINYDLYPTGIADMWGTTVLTNDGGTWEGEWVGSIHSDGTHTTYEMLIGTGDYAGLRYSYFTVFGDPSGEFPEKQPGLSGWIEPTDQT